MNAIATMPICVNTCAAGCRLKRHKHPSDSRRALRALRQYNIARLPMNKERVTPQVTRPLNTKIGDASARSFWSIFAEQIHAERSGTHFGRCEKSTATKREGLIERNEEKRNFSKREVSAFYRPNVRELRAECSGNHSGRYKKSTATEREGLIERNEEKRNFSKREVCAFYRPELSSLARVISVYLYAQTI